MLRSRKPPAGLTFKSLGCALLYANLVPAQSPIAQRARLADTAPDSVATLEFSHDLAFLIASHSPGAANVVREDQSGVNAVNPAVLGAQTGKEDMGYVYSSLAPDLNLPDMYGSSLYYSRAMEPIGFSIRQTVSSLPGAYLDLNISRPTGEVVLKEFAVAAGMEAFSTGDFRHHFGLALKYVQAPDVIGERDLGSNGYLCDLGYYGKFREHLRLGISVLNAGMPVAGLRPVLRKETLPGRTRTEVFQLSDGDYLLTPPTLAAGLAYGRYLMNLRLYILDWGATAAIAQTFHRAGLQDAAWSWDGGVHLKLLNTFSVEAAAERSELGPGLRGSFGITLFNHLFASVSAAGADNPVSSSRRAFALGVTNLFLWDSQDLTWWFKPKVEME